MHANSAKSGTARTVAIVVYDHVKLLDVTGPLQVFSDARNEDGAPAYRVQLVSSKGEQVSTDTALALPAKPLTEALDVDTVIVAGGVGALEARYSTALTAFSRHAFVRARRLCSVCLGAFILAEAGILKGRCATTHWSKTHDLQSSYPETTVLGDRIFVRDGPVWTSAGVTAGIDMALALVEEDLGLKEALRLARVLVVPIKRHGGQSQFSVGLRHQISHTSGKFDALLAAIQERPGDPHTVPLMAARTHMSERNFARVFRAEIGKSPAQFVEEMRVEAARDALLNGAIALKDAAAHFGFGSDENMRRAFKRQFGVTPSSILEQFSSN
ncbi:MAG: DJ-1/PfpI family protein [Pseudomonadota bacterium]